MHSTSSHRHGVCSIVPPYILQALADQGRRAAMQAAQRTVAHDEAIRRLRAARAPGRQPSAPAAPEADDGPHRSRTVADAKRTMRLPGTAVRTEGEGPTGDLAVD